jgi:hypothetical protein
MPPQGNTGSELHDPAHAPRCIGCVDHRHEGFRNLRASVAGHYVQRRADRSPGKTEGWPYAVRPDDPELAEELKRFPVFISDDRIFPPRAGAEGTRRLATSDNHHWAYRLRNR